MPCPWPWSLKTNLHAQDVMRIMTQYCRFLHSGTIGHASSVQRHRQVLRHQGPQEGRGVRRRRRGVHHGGEARLGPGLATSFPHTPLLHLPEQGMRCHPQEKYSKPGILSYDYIYTGVG